MSPNINQLDDLKAVVSSIAARVQDWKNCITAISQVSYEYLLPWHMSCITVYTFNPQTGAMELVAMPGVAEPELMWGPTDKLLFADYMTSETVIWCETEAEFQHHMAQLHQLPMTIHMPEGEFRKRQSEKHQPQLGKPVTLATAIFYLRKGIGQTNDRVGMVFYNFIRSNKGQVFTPPIKSCLKFITTLIREVQIQETYHCFDRPTSSWVPDLFIRSINNYFDAALPADRHMSEIETDLANLVANTALEITGNFSGHADLLYVIGNRILRSCKKGKSPVSILLLNDSITARTLDSGKYMIAQDVSDKLRDEIIGTDHENCSSLMFAPITLGGENRALLRLSSQNRGHFLDFHAKTLQRLATCASFGILRAEEYAQRHQTQMALEFFTQSKSGVEGYDDRHVLLRASKALAAEWELYYELCRNSFIIKQGMNFSEKGFEELDMNSPDVAIRLKDGFTSSLFECQKKHLDRTVVWVVHFPDEASNCEYFVQVLIAGNRSNTGVQEIFRSPCGYLQCAEHCEGCRMRQGVVRNPNTRAQKGKTLLAFVVRDLTRFHGIVWLQLHMLREIRPWEKEYLFGIAGSLGHFLSLNGFHVAMRAFNHMIPDTANSILASYWAHVKSLDENEYKMMEPHVWALREKIGEVRSLFPREDISMAHQWFAGNTVGAFVTLALMYVNRTTEYNAKVWQTCYLFPGVEEDNVSGLFYSVLTNLLQNVQQHSKWSEYFPEKSDLEQQRMAIVVIDKHKSKIEVYVGNNGTPLTDDPFTLRPSGDHRVGLRAMREILLQQKGEICWLPTAPSKMISKVPSLAKCNALFRFRMRQQLKPKQEKQS